MNLMKAGLVLSSLSILQTAALAEPGWLQVNDNGVLTCSGLTMSVSHHGPGWKSKTQDSVLSAKAGQPVRADGEFTLHGKLVVDSGQECDFKEKVVGLATDTVNYQASVQVPEGVQTNELALRIKLPMDKYAGKKLQVDDTEITLPETFDKAKWLRLSRPLAKKVSVPVDGAKLTFTGEFPLFLQDDRPYGANSYSLRICFTPARGLIKDASLALLINRTPYESSPIAMAKQCNMGFKDELSEDHKGGWTDQGPENDLRAIRPGLLNVGGVKFNIVDPAKNGGLSCLALKGEERGYFAASAEVPASGRFRFLYLLHTLAWATSFNGEVGKLVVKYQDGSSTTINVMAGDDVGDWWKPAVRPNGAVAWTAENKNAHVGLFMSRFAIERKPLAAVELVSNGKVVWMVVAMTGADEDIPLPVERSQYITAGSDWKPIEFERDILKGSVLDSSAQLDSPAGKYGFVVSRDGNLEFAGRPGVPVKFYGANLCRRSAMMSTKEWNERLADRLARIGYNAMRLMIVDDHIVKKTKTSSTELDPVEMDKLDHMFSCLKQRGIYVTIDMYTYRKLVKGEIEEFPDVEKLVPLFPSLVFVSESAMANWERLSKNWLTHLNPYTGLQWKDDPALMGISLINEDSIFDMYKKSPYTLELFQRKFEGWLGAKGLASVESQRKKELFNEFLMEKYRAGFERMKRFLQGLGVKTLITDQNHCSSIPLALLRDEYDYVDVHVYWDHPSDINGFPAAIHNRSAISNSAQTTEVFTQRIFGKPAESTEWNFVHPNESKAEGGAMFPAYSALQNWDAVFRFTYAHDEPSVKGEEVGTGRRYFNVVMDPIYTLSEKIGVAFFLRGDVKQSQLFLPLLLSMRYADAIEKVEAYPQGVKRLGLIGQTGTIVLDRELNPTTQNAATLRAIVEAPAFAGVEKGLAVGKVGKPYFLIDPKNDLVAEMAQAGYIDSSLVDVEKGVYRSSTGQIELSQSAETFKVVTPKSEALVVPTGKTLAGDFMQVENKVSRGVFFASSVDGQKLAESGRLLLLHLTDCQNSLMKFGNQSMTSVAGWGGLPLLIKRGEARITLKGKFDGFKLYAVSTAGERLFELKYDTAAQGIVFNSSVFTEKGPVLAYELVKER